MEQSGKKKMSHNTNVKWLVDLTVDHINLPKQETVQITKTEIVQ